MLQGKDAPCGGSGASVRVILLFHDCVKIAGGRPIILTYILVDFFCSFFFSPDPTFSSQKRSPASTNANLCENTSVNTRQHHRRRSDSCLLMICTLWQLANATFWNIMNSLKWWLQTWDKHSHGSPTWWQSCRNNVVSVNFSLLSLTSAAVENYILHVKTSVPHIAIHNWTKPRIIHALYLPWRRNK